MPSLSQLTGMGGRRLSDLLPTPARLFLESMGGKRDPITEADFSPEELEAIRQLVEQPKTVKGVGYQDYDPSMLEQPGLAGLLTPRGRVANSLGQFQYRKGPEGTTVTDKYDFNPTYKDESALIQALSALGTGGFSPLHTLGEYLMPPGKGRDVRIKLR